MKICLEHSNIDDHLRIINSDFIEKLLRKETYNGKNERTYISSISNYFLILLIVFSVSSDEHTFLHYDHMIFSTLQQYCFDKAADIHVFDNHDYFLLLKNYSSVVMKHTQVKQSNRSLSTPAFGFGYQIPASNS